MENYIMQYFCLDTQYVSTFNMSPHLEVVPHDEGQLPEAGEGLGGAGRDHAVVEYLVVQGVGPAGGLVLGRVTHQHSLLDF